jgi:CheY-like chemotaxis protein
MPDKQQGILIVDDESSIRRVLNQKLLKEGYRCEEADSAGQAMNWLASNAVEAVILDIETPGRSGIEMLKEMKAKYPDTSVIVTAESLVTLMRHYGLLLCQMHSKCLLHQTRARLGPKHTITAIPSPKKAMFENNANFIWLDVVTRR